MKVLFCGGGTAGHVSPALAIGEAVLSESPENEIAFVGRKHGAENNLVEKAGYALYEVEVSGFPRSFGKEQWKALEQARRAEADAKRILREFQPDVVVGTGGYVCFPVLRAANKLKIPTVLHEANAAPGLAVKMLAPRCRYVLTNLADEDSRFFRKKHTVCVGMPVREGFYSMTRERARKSLGIKPNEFTVLSFGGSIGAQVLNERCLALMQGLSGISGVRHIHGCGNRYWEEIREKYPSLCEENGKFRILPFIHDMPRYMAAADLVICRSGAGSISELAATGTPAILIPSPNVTGDHQLLNAKEAEKEGCAIVIEEQNLTDEGLLEVVLQLKKNPKALADMKEAAKKLAHPRSAEESVAILKKAVCEA